MSIGPEGPFVLGMLMLWIAISFARRSGKEGDGQGYALLALGFGIISGAALFASGVLYL